MAELPVDDNGVPTSAQKINPAAPTPSSLEWSQYNVMADGGDITKGTKADAANPWWTGSSSVISLLKGAIYRLAGISTSLGTSASALGKAEDSAHASGDTGVMMLGVVNATATALGESDGDYGPPSLDSNRRLRVIPVDPEGESITPSNASTSALATSLVVKASAGKIWGFQGYLDSTGTDGYIQVHNTASLPADTAVPVEAFPIVAGRAFSIDFGRKGRYCSTGITLVYSSTGPTKTIGSAKLWVGCQYE